MIPRLHYFWLFACALVAWPVWQLGCRWRRRPGTGNSPLRVLVIPQTNRIGDMVCATPVLRAIKMRFPECYVAVLVSRGKKAWQVFEHNPRVDEIIFYETPGFVRHIRRRRFHWSFALTNYPLPSIVALLGLVPNRVKTVISDRTLAERLTDCFNTHLVRYEHHTYLPRHYLR
ncbi:MAG: hypothetical protein U1A16_04025, partial [Patescibacteria group bacterium]|nr:hypothetical protein [Patescibacteria group bacterium]